VRTSDFLFYDIRFGILMRSEAEEWLALYPSWGGCIIKACYREAPGSLEEYGRFLIMLHRVVLGKLSLLELKLCLEYFDRCQLLVQHLLHLHAFLVPLIAHYL
jgi:hypothetical protein